MNRTILLLALYLVASFLPAEDKAPKLIKTMLDTESLLKLTANEDVLSATAASTWNTIDHDITPSYILAVENLLFDSRVMHYEDEKDAHSSISENIDENMMPVRGQARIFTFFGGAVPDIPAQIVHLGLDIESDSDIAVSIGNGIVDSIGVDLLGLGQFVYVYYGKGIYCIYGHLDRIDVKLGQLVKSGEVIGRIGNTGFSRRKCLHFAICYSPIGAKIFKARTYYNPQLFCMKAANW